MEGRTAPVRPSRSSPRRTPSATMPWICLARSSCSAVRLLAAGGIARIQARWIANSSGKLSRMLILSQVSASSFATVVESLAITAR
jgi:hypothetical protein